jgi:hypothetical protein
MEGDQNRFSLMLRGKHPEPVKNGFMAYMNPVE